MTPLLSRGGQVGEAREDASERVDGCDGGEEGDGQVEEDGEEDEEEEAQLLAHAPLPRARHKVGPHHVLGLRGSAHVPGSA